MTAGLLIFVTKESTPPGKCAKLKVLFGVFTNTQNWQHWHYCQLCNPTYLQFFVPYLHWRMVVNMKFNISDEMRIIFQGWKLHWSRSFLMAELKRSWQCCHSCIMESLWKTLVKLKSYYGLAQDSGPTRHTSGRSRISPRKGRHSGGGTNIRICQIFPKTAWNWKNLDPGGRTSLRSATDYFC